MASSRPTTTPSAAPAARSDAPLKDALLAEIRKSQVVFYNTVVAQAQRVETEGDRITFVFSPTQRTLKDMFEQKRALLEGVAAQVSGRKIAVLAVQAAAEAPSDAASAAAAAQQADAQEKKATLRDQAMADAGVQALLEVFPAEIRDVEKM